MNIEIKGITDAKETDSRTIEALSFIGIAWDDLDDFTKVRLLAELFKTLDPLDMSNFDYYTNRLKMDEDTNRFVALIEKHSDDEEFENKEIGDGYDGDEFFIPYANAWEELVREKGESWGKTHDYSFGAENKYDVYVYGK